MKLQILFVTGRLGPWRIGGTGQVEYHLVNQLACNNNVHTTLMGTIPPGAVNPDSYYSSKLDIYPIKTTQHPDSFLDLLISNLLYPLLAHKANYDIIHFNVLPGLRTLSLLKLFLARNEKAKLIVAVHGFQNEVETYTESRVRKTLARMHWALARRYLNDFDAVIVNSSYMKHMAIGMGVLREKVVVIPNGISNEMFAERRAETSDNLVLCYANFYPIKGQELLIKAFAKSGAAGSSKLVLVGTGSSNYQQQCVNLARKLNIAASTTFTGSVSRDDLMKLILRAKVCVFPSIVEPFGIGILESMAMGKPVIASKFGGPHDFLVDGKEGFLIDPSDTDTFGKRLRILCDDAALGQSFGKNAKLKAQQFTWDSVVQKYVSLYFHLHRAEAGSG